jgi:hypothetical protein
MLSFRRIAMIIKQREIVNQNFLGNMDSFDYMLRLLKSFTTRYKFTKYKHQFLTLC